MPLHRIITRASNEGPLDQPIPKHTFLITTMKDEFFDQGRNGNRDGYTPRNEQAGRFASRSARPRFARESRVGSSSMKSNRYDNAASSGRWQERNERNAGSVWNEHENRPQQRRFFSPEGGERNYDDNRSPAAAASRWSKRRTPYGGGQNGPAYRANSGEGYCPRFRGGEGENGGYKRRPNGGGGYKPKSVYSQKKRIEYAETHVDPNQPVRLNKFLANAGVCSRRDADKYIQAGVVSVNGEIVTELGTKVMRTDVVLFHDNAVRMEKKQYVLLNKPKGYVTTSEDPQNRKTVMDLVRNACPERIYPVGRLDRNTTGVLLLTNDGELATRLTHPKFLKKKIYHVTTDQNVTATDLRQIAEGVVLEDGEIRADAVEYCSATDKKQVGIEIHSGKNRIVRRIFESLGYKVVKLDRVYFAGLTKKNVKRGDWRYLTEKEVNMLRMGAYE